MNRLDLDIANDVSELEKVVSAVETLAEEWEIPPKVAMHLNLVLEEVVTNVMFYAYTDEHHHDIHIEFSRGDDNTLSVVVSDDGRGYNPLERPDDPGLDKPLEERKIGGLGIHFMKTFMDRVEYVRRDDRNVMTFTKKY
jgi:anti-sigma regulatory factor (Ser/Thr protein kinase)